MPNNEFVVPVNPPEKKCCPEWKKPCKEPYMPKAKLVDFIVLIYLHVTDTFRVRIYVSIEVNSP